MSEMATARVLITGRVQGVGFRYFVTSTADRYPVKGYVRNLETGAVEIEAEGEKKSVHAFLTAVRPGPSNAQVSEFQLEWKPYEDKYQDFSVKY